MTLAVPWLMTRDFISASMPPLELPSHGVRFCYVNISQDATLVCNSGHHALIDQRSSLIAHSFDVDNVLF